jgi:hypothetical protein
MLPRLTAVIITGATPNAIHTLRLGAVCVVSVNTSMLSRWRGTWHGLSRHPPHVTRFSKVFLEMTQIIRRKYTTRTYLEVTKRLFKFAIFSKRNVDKIVHVGILNYNAMWTSRLKRFGGTHCFHLQGLSGYSYEMLVSTCTSTLC